MECAASCTSYAAGPDWLSTWVAGDHVFSWVINVLIALALIGVIWRTLWHVLVYRRRPLCVDCRRLGDNVRTKFDYKGTPVCTDHWEERDMAAEKTYRCPEHDLPMTKYKNTGVTVDMCDEGCIFLNAGELEQITASASARGQTNGTAIGIVLGSVI